ncbi:LysR family transcriptional regulator [Sphingomonas colocasiae]|uniref:LysR family transcriptional regulator n=1 Tax=Sphingomonas colocasiae TaxID=1848973 RepID=A0ABS7PSK2_9SPHN|nr:LysR family transcriptional regulator [Sphingomonas colocasiae]MBY8824318.1 LysR family transcriptional regulator [Sphingomonas colocasiae]
MDLNARPLRAFVAVAELGSFRRAAYQLGISQPALSAQIREMERQFGFDLFARTSRHVTLTAEGSLFLDRARRLVLETDWMNQAARAIRSDELRVGAAHHSAQIPERQALIERFMRTNPDVPLRIRSRTHAQLYEELAGNEIDLAITLEVSPAGIHRSALDPAAGREVRRWVLGERPIGLLLPEEMAGAPDALTGMTIGRLNRAHGIPLSEAVAHWLAQAGAHAVDMPEGDGPSLVRYGALLRRPVVSLGWFGAPPPTMIERQVATSLRTALVVLARPDAQRRGAARFIAMLDSDQETARDLPSQ